MYQLTTLGRITLSRDGKELRRVSSHRQKVALLTYLAMEGQTARDTLLALFWGEREQERARHSLSQTLYELRRELGEEFLDSTGDRLALAENLFRVDVAEFRAAADDGRWADALSVYRGSFLPGFYLDAPGFESWLEAQRGELERLQRRAHQELLKEACRGGDLKSALAVARRWVTNDPLHDEAQRHLITLLGAMGQRSEAIQQYERYAARLKREYGLEPLDDIRELVDQMRGGDLPSVAVGPTADAPPYSVSSKAEPVSEVAVPGEAAVPSELPPAERGERRVVRVLLVYAGYAYAALEATGLFTEQFALSRTVFVSSLAILLIGGLVMTFALAWPSPERTAGGIVGWLADLGRAIWPLRWLRARAARVRAEYVFLFMLALVATLLAFRHFRPFATRMDDFSILAVPFSVGFGYPEADAEHLHEYIKLQLEQVEAGRLKVLDAQGLVPGAAPDQRAAILLARKHGARYVLMCELWGSEDELTVVPNLVDARRVARLGGFHQIGSKVDVLTLVDRVALDVYDRLAGRLGLPMVDAGSMEQVPPAARWAVISGVHRFRRAEYKKAAAEFRRAIEADTGFALAYFHLSLAEYWMPTDVQGMWLDSAKLTLQEAVRRSERLGHRAEAIARAQLLYMQGDVQAAIKGYEQAQLRYPDDLEALLGLAESYYHLGPYAGRSPADAEGAFEKLVEADSSFTLAYYHLIDLAYQRDDSVSMRRYLDRFLELSASDPDNPQRAWMESLWRLEYGSSRERADVIREPPPDFENFLKYLFKGGRRLALADSVARQIAVSDRYYPVQRQKGRQIRFVGLTALGQWDEAIEQRHAAVREGADPDYDSWVVMSYLAGYPMADLAGPMISDLRQRLNDPLWPADTLSFSHIEQQRFRGLVQYAAVQGDSALVGELQARLKQRAGNPFNSVLPSQQAALDARLAMLAGDTTAAIIALRRSLSRFDEPWSAYAPGTVMALQRLQLAELLIDRGDYEGAFRWLDSFEWSFALVDVFFLDQARTLKTLIGEARTELGR